MIFLVRIFHSCLEILKINRQRAVWNTPTFLIFLHSDEQTPSKDSQSPDAQKEAEEQTNAKSATQASAAATKGSYGKSSQLDQVCVFFSLALLARVLSGEIPLCFF